MMSNAEGTMGADMDVQSANVEVSLQLEGELLWDLAGGHFHALELAGDMASTVVVEMTVDMGSQSMDIEQAVSMAGKQRIKASANRR
jgi:hypothetical protein